jgi:hypothetical protein
MSLLPRATLHSDSEQILLIQCVPMDRWPSVREGFYDRLPILLIKNKKSLTDGSITSMKMRPKVSIDSIDQYHRYRSIDPSLIVPIYGRLII